MRMNVIFLTLLLVIPPSIVMAEDVDSSTNARSTTSIAMALIQTYVWSNQTAQVQVILNNAPLAQSLRAVWTLSDDQHPNLLSGASSFQSQGTSRMLTIELEQFYAGGHFHTLAVDVLDTSNQTHAYDQLRFVVFQQVMVSQVADLYVFGDSLSDAGNAYNSVLSVPDVPPYWQGRFSNGPIWVDEFSSALGLMTSIGSGTAQGDNRAFGGAQTGQGYSYLLLPNVGTQINNYLGQVQSSIPGNVVISLWAGGNDFLYGTGNPNVIATNIVNHVRTLALAGGQTFLIPNVPPLEMTPEGTSRSQSQQNQLAQDVVTYNALLATEMNNLSASLGITIYQIDAWTIFNEIVANQGAFGITDVQNPACMSSGSILPLPICNSGDPVVSNVDEYLFFDKAHPTSVTHSIIAAYALGTIGTNDTDGDGIIDEVDDCPWTSDTIPVNSTGCSWDQRDEDGDGVVNGEDDCLQTSPNDSVNDVGCAAYQRDTDQDGLTDDIDPCPDDHGEHDHDGDGCSDGIDLDDDDDGIDDDVDNCPLGMIGIHDIDLDKDGCHDHEDDDIDGDQSSNTDEASDGTDPLVPDTDNDGTQDGSDAFPLDPDEWNDTDGDGHGDNSDEFPYDPGEWKDMDGDGHGDNSDAFPENRSEWSNSDDDMFGDNLDSCPFDTGQSKYPEGCPDQDEDGFADMNDHFPYDSTQWRDTDGDGRGDNYRFVVENRTGLRITQSGDAFPFDKAQWSDMDGDGYGDNLGLQTSDHFPEDETEWFDSDEDGYGDNSDAFPNERTQWSDLDDDGWGDNYADPTWSVHRGPERIGEFVRDAVNPDLFPLESTQWKDSDDDGFGDNSSLTAYMYDRCPLEYGTAIDTWGQGCPDRDGDGTADNEDMCPTDATLTNETCPKSEVGLGADFGGQSSGMTSSGVMMILAVLVLISILLLLLVSPRSQNDDEKGDELAWEGMYPQESWSTSEHQDPSSMDSLLDDSLL